MNLIYIIYIIHIIINASLPKEQKWANIFYLHASFGCPVTKFMQKKHSGLEFSGCSHVASLFTTEEQKKAGLQRIW